MTPASPSRLRLAVLALLLGILLVGLGRVAMLPPFEGYDETGHYSYVAEMAALGTWPARGDPMSAETDDYARVAPTPPSAGGTWRYRAMVRASDADKAAARAAVSGPTAEDGWRRGAVANWEAQHPPLYYALLAPAFRWARGWSLGSRLLLLRSLSYALAWAGLCSAVWAAAGSGRADSPHATPRSVAILAPLLWPMLLPEWFPEMARLGNDALVAALVGVVALGLPRLLAAGRPAAGPGRHAGVGAAVGLGLLAKATVLPLGAAIGVLLLTRAWRDRAERHARLLGLAAFVFAVLAVAGWWYIGQALTTGDPIGANDGINLAHGEGLWRGLQHHLSATALARMVYDFDLSLVWGGTWSFVVPPLSLIAPMMIAFPILVAAGLLARRRGFTLRDAVTPLTLLLFTLALVYYSLVLIAGGGLGQPAWYLHAFVPVLWPLLAWGIDAARRWRAIEVLLVVDLVYAPLFLLLATAGDAAVYAGCAGTRGGDRYLDVGAALSCVSAPGRLIDGLALLASPWLALALLAAGFACVAAGIGLGIVQIVARHPASDGSRPSAGEPSADLMMP